MSAASTAHIAQLWRYPVKSMRGEQVDELDLLPDGIAHDRRYAIESSAAPAGKPLLTGRERTGMLLYTATVRNGETWVRTPHGNRFAVEDPELLHTIQAGAPGTLRLLRSDRPLTDVRPVSILSLQTIARLSHELDRPIDARRFRANILLSLTPAPQPQPAFPAFQEDSFVGHTLRIGSSATLRITERDPRCRIVILDPDTTAPDTTLMKHLDRHHGGRLGIYATPLTPGPLRIGDPVFLT